MRMSTYTWPHIWLFTSVHHASKRPILTRRHYVEGDEMKRNNVRYNNNEAAVCEGYLTLYLPELGL